MHPGPVIALRLVILLALLSASWIAETAWVGAQGAAAPVSVTLPTGQDWTATSVVVNVGDQVRIEASGSSPMGPAVPAGTPAGTPACTPTQQFVAPALPCYALIGRLDQTAPFLIGDGVTFNVKLPGELFLGVNDDYFADNEGTWDVTILVTPAAERQGTPASTPAPARETNPPPDVAETLVALAPLSGGQQVTLLRGSCRDPIAVASALGTTTVPVGEFRGQAGAVAVASVTAIAPLSFDMLLASDYAIVVAAPVEEQGRVLACGDLGAVANQMPRETSVGLSPEGGSGWAGIAYLAPSIADPASTVVTVFVSPGLTSAPAG